MFDLVLFQMCLSLCLVNSFKALLLRLLKTQFYLFIYLFFSIQLSAKPVPWPISLVNSHSQKKFKVKKNKKSWMDLNGDKQTAAIIG